MFEIYCVEDDESIRQLIVNYSGVELLNGDNKLSYCGEDFIKLSRDYQLYRALDKSIETNSSNKIVIDYGEKHLNIY